LTAGSGFGDAAGTRVRRARLSGGHWIDGQLAQRGTVGAIGFGADDAAAARALAGNGPD
jgi:hypothetical protein